MRSKIKSAMSRHGSGGRIPVLALIAAAILLLSLVWGFRGARPTWADETFTLRLPPVHSHLFWDKIKRDVHPPLYFALGTLARDPRLRSPMNPSYPSPPTVRLFSYLLFLVLMWLTLRLAAERTEKPGQIALPALLTFASAHLALFGPMLRYYGLCALGITCATMLLVPPSNEPDRAGGTANARRAVWYCVSMWVALASSYMTAIVIPAHLAYLLRRPKAEARPFWIALLVLAIACIPLLLLLRTQIENMPGTEWPGLTGLVVGAVARGVFVLYSFVIGEFVRPWDWWLSIPALAAFLCLVFLAWSTRNSRFGGLLWLNLLICLPIGAVALAWIGVGVEFSAARLFFLAPMFLVLMGLGASSEGISANARRVGSIAVAVLVAVNLVSSFNFRRAENYIQSTYIIPWSAMSHDIAGLAEDFDSTAVYTDDPTMHFWLRQDDPQSLRSADIDYLMWEALKDPDAQEQRPPELAVFVYSPRRYSDEDINWAASRALHAEPKIMAEIEYVQEDGTSIRWKSMLLRRPVYAVKKKLVAFCAAG